MDEDTLELHVSDTLDTQDSDDRFEALQLSLQRWPLINEIHLHHLHQYPIHYLTMSGPQVNPQTKHLLEPEAIPIPADPSCRVCGDSAFDVGELLEVEDCGCYQCNDCLTRPFNLAMTDESVYPPKCHRRPIPLDMAAGHLPRSLVRAYEAKLPELSTRKRVYCSNIRGGCNAFIAPHSIHNGEAFCQKCNSKTCVKCREAGHFGPCQNNDVTELAKDEKWKVCPGCTRLVEKADGCNHILCRCGCDFCYSCGLVLKKCACIDEDEEENDDCDEVWFARGPVAATVPRRPRTPSFRELEEDIIEDTLVAPFDLVEDEFTDR